MEANALNGTAVTVIKVECHKAQKSVLYHPFMTLWIKDTVLTIFVLKSVKLVVSVLQDLPVTLSPIFVFPRTNVTLGQWNQNVM